MESVRNQSQKNSGVKPRIAVVDMNVTRNSPAGSCVLAEVMGLANEFDITVFSDAFDDDGTGRVRWVRIPLPRRPVLFRYLVFHFLAPPRYLLWRLSGNSTVYIQGTQGQFVGADVAYAHFCHRAYLKGAWRESQVTGLRRFARWLNHSFNAIFEKRAFYRAKKIVAPSRGLRRELGKEYPAVADRIVTIANPVDIARFSRPDGFDRQAHRAQLGVSGDEIALSFMALGDFARKGLGLLIAALGQLPEAQRAQLRLIVIGGQQGEIASFSRDAERMGIADRVVFVGMQNEVRDFLWVTDAYVFPSAYETFSLAVYQAAAAGLPVLVSENLYGAEDLVRDGENGWVVSRNTDGVASGLARVIADRERLAQMAACAVESAQSYSQEVFRGRWANLYASGLTSCDKPVMHPDSGNDLQCKHSHD